MEKIQTAIQELISELKQLKQTIVLSHSLKAIDDCIYLAYAKMEKEKQQIENAYRIGSVNELTFGENKAEQYYNKTFKSE